MKISEAIAELQKILETEGDLRVTYNTGNVSNLKSFYVGHTREARPRETNEHYFVTYNKEDIQKEKVLCLYFGR